LSPYPLVNFPTDPIFNLRTKPKNKGNVVRSLVILGALLLPIPVARAQQTSVMDEALGRA